MKKSYLDYRVPYELCDCRLVGADKIGNPVWDECFRCSVMRIQRERHRKIEWCLLIAYCVVGYGGILYTLGFDMGWW